MEPSSANPHNRPVALSLRLYRRLAAAFPSEFRDTYGEDLLQAAEDAVEDVWRRHGAIGLVRFLADIALRVPIEHAIEVRHDIRFALRTLRTSPAFTAVALLSLSLGVGIAVSAFSETNGLVMRAIPGVPHPEQLVTLELPTSYLAGVTAYSVVQRRHEIGIRVALGAQRSQVLGLVMKEGAVLVASGTVLGLASGAAGLRMLSAMFSEVARTTTWTETDSALLLVAPLLLAAVALTACYLPARKSTSIDPVVALRQE